MTPVIIPANLENRFAAMEAMVAALVRSRKILGAVSSLPNSELKTSIIREVEFVLNSSSDDRASAQARFSDLEKKYNELLATWQSEHEDYLSLIDKCSKPDGSPEMRVERVNHVPPAFAYAFLLSMVGNLVLLYYLFLA